MTKTVEYKNIKVGKVAEESLQTSRNRLLVVTIIFSLAFLVISFRLFDVSSSGRKETSVSSNEPADDTINSLPFKHRANIVDRNGILLAVNLGTASVYANPKEIIDVDEAVEKIHQVFPQESKESLIEKLSQNRSFTWIKRNITPKEQYEINALGIPGIYYKDEEKRIYPHKNLASHIVGFVNVDGKGMAGIERQFDKYLSDYNDETNNKTLQLSMDIRVQSIVHTTLRKTIEEFKAAGASAIVMDVNTGEIISMVNLPDYDPNNPGEATHEQLFNTATLGVYEMGSTFKTFNTAMGLESGKIHMDDSFDVSKPIKISRFTIRDFHPKDGFMSIPEIYIHSSNIGSVKIAMEVGSKGQKDFMEKLGLLKPLKLEIPEAGNPLYPSSWSDIRTMTISYGHGIAVTPMHLISATSAMINGGNLYQPTFLARKNGERLISHQVISEKTSENIRKLMRFVVEYGTGKNADAEGYFVGGKTGSADKAEGGSYNRHSIISSFMGAFPINKPKYAILVMVDSPVGNERTGGFATGGAVAAPAVKEIIERAAPILGVQPVDKEDNYIKREFWYDNNEEKAQTASAKTYM